MSDFEKFLALYVLLKLKIVKGKGLIFVRSINRCFRLKLFLERLSINAALLNSELPQNSRSHILKEFNKGVFDYLIATDENFVDEVKKEQEEEEKEEEQEDVEENEEEKDEKKKKGKKGDKEYGVSRGVDFKGVANVINFDFPDTPKNYVHRAGRTARGGKSGNVLSFVRSNDLPLLEQVQSLLKEEGRSIDPFDFNLDIMEGFRYRCTDVFNSVGKPAVQQARIKELKSEILNSKKLRAHFEDNPVDVEMLKHDRSLSSSSKFTHLKHIPLYLQPDVRTAAVLRSAMNKNQSENFRHTKGKRSLAKAMHDPLKSFNFEKPKKVKLNEKEYDELGRKKKYRKKKKRSRF